MGKLYVINDTPLFGVSRKERRVALRREQSGDAVLNPEFPTPPPLSARDDDATSDDLLVAGARPLVTRTRPSSRAALHLLAAYLLGPLSVGWWTTGRSRTLWGGLGLASALAAATFMCTWSSFLEWAEVTRGGVVTWIAVVTVVPVTAFAAWSRAIAAAARRHPVIPPGRLRHPRIALVLGALVPGLGFQVTGRSSRAAKAFGAAGPLLAGALVLVHGSWLWAVTRSGAPGAPSGDAIEITFVVAALVTVAMTMLWIGHAVAAARLVPAERREPRAGVLSVLLMIALAMFVGTQAGVPLAGYLHDGSTLLRAQGLRLIPLGLCTAAARLDATQPAYLADVAALNGLMGRTENARDARRTLAERSTAYQTALRDASPSLSEVARADETAAGGGSAWTRLRTLSQ